MRNRPNVVFVLTDVFFAQAMTFIEQHRDEPFFCYISTNAPHSPFNVARHYRALYDGKTDSQAYARFLGMITNIDDNVGRLRAKLAALELEDDTILAGIDGADVEIQCDDIEPGAEGMYVGGNALAFDTACLAIEGTPQQTVRIEPKDSGARFVVRLEPGPVHVRAVFSDRHGAYMSAYYVYVRRGGAVGQS